jgi:superfamily I DNA/RNA helicase
MSKFPPTPEQQAIIDAAQNTKDNLIVSALAGAAKTSTLVLIAEALKDTQILCLAFNKRIAVEMQERLPSNCTAMTLNSLGHRVWSEVVSKRLILKESKTFEILSRQTKELPQKTQELVYENFAEIKKTIDYSKVCGFIPIKDFPRAKSLISADDFFADLEEAPSIREEELILNVVRESIQLGLEGIIDFNDQIILPTLFPSMFPFYPLVMVDEAQDLSSLNHATLHKLAKRRLVAVGDENQAIYAFRGAHEDSMLTLQQAFNMKKLQLSISFRCPQAVVREAQWRAPHMRWPEWAREGNVTTLSSWSATDIPPSAAIICRNNAPLFNMAIKLLKNGRFPQIIGNDIGKYLVKVMKKFGKTDLPQARVFTAIDDWTTEKLKKSRAPSKVYDQADCLRIFANQSETLGGAIAYAEHLFNSQGPITLMTGHKSKGLEFDTVFFLDQHLIKSEEFEQEKNLKYVIQTRAKEQLIYVESSTFEDNSHDTE